MSLLSAPTPHKRWRDAMSSLFLGSYFHFLLYTECSSFSKQGISDSADCWVHDLRRRFAIVLWGLRFCVEYHIWLISSKVWRKLSEWTRMILSSVTVSSPNCLLYPASLPVPTITCCGNWMWKCNISQEVGRTLVYCALIWSCIRGNRSHNRQRILFQRDSYATIFRESWSDRPASCSWAYCRSASLSPIHCRGQRLFWVCIYLSSEFSLDCREKCILWRLFWAL